LAEVLPKGAEVACLLEQDQAIDEEVDLGLNVAFVAEFFQTERCDVGS
jgi:hypothetical protein